jgi:FMN phosphatase YigB (HAD superfamily)
LLRTENQKPIFRLPMLDFTRFKVLTFDCYGTMIDWETGIFSAMRPILAAHDKKITDSALLELYSELELAAESSAEKGQFVRYRLRRATRIQAHGRRSSFSARIAGELAAVSGHSGSVAQTQDSLPTCGDLQCR